MDTSNRGLLTDIAYYHNTDEFQLYFIVGDIGLKMLYYDSYRKSSVYNFDLIMNFILNDENWKHKPHTIFKFLDRYPEYKVHLLLVRGI
jgi:spore coat polysaccharide biosynthesis predicted glycosyltransferase SpsG